MNITFTSRGLEDYQYWGEYDRKMFKKIGQLLIDIKRHPFDGIGQPEPLKHDFSGMWSRRITQEHRLVYKVMEGSIIITQCRYHY